MRISILLCLLLTAGPLPAGARVIRIWSRDELLAAADLAVIGTPVTTRDLAETNSLGWSSTATFQSRFRGVETTIHITDVLKGSPASDRLVLHHYRYELTWGSPPNGPCLASLEPNDTNPWVLFLVKDAAGQYAPVTGQEDSALSLRPLTTESGRTAGLPVLPPMADANPALRHPIALAVPKRLLIHRTADIFAVVVDTNSFISTNLTVGTNMAFGTQYEWYIYPAGTTRPAHGEMGLTGSFSFPISPMQWSAASDYLSPAGKKYKTYRVELALTAFETDIPAQHMWSPAAGSRYQVLWQWTLKQTIKP